MNKALKKAYLEMTKEEAKREVALLKKELGVLYKQVEMFEQCLAYLKHKV